MLINFSIQNFGSIKDKQTLSFEADKSQHLEDYYIIRKNGLRLLKLALIYGSNASGKTTILNALQFLMKIVLNSREQKTQSLNFEPFLFDQSTPKQNTIFYIDFIQNDIRYLYEIELNKKSVVKEKLSYAKNPKNTKKALSIFERTTNFEKQLTNIAFNSEIEIDDVTSKTLVANTLWNNTVLSGFLKTNLESKELTDVVTWFKEYLNPVIYTKSELDDFITSSIEEHKICKTAVLDILKKADFNLSDIFIKKEEKDIPNGFLGFLEKQKGVTENEIQELRNKGKITAINIEFEHTVNGKSYFLPFEDESQGTQRYYGFAGLLYLMIKNSTAFPIDELESSLHPDLYLHFLLSFLLNAKNSQIIATTHNREILDNKDIFRNDTIWFTDKQESCSTELYSLADFDSSVVRNTTNILNAYKSGKLSATPNLGDTFIDLNL